MRRSFLQTIRRLPKNSVFRHKTSRAPSFATQHRRLAYERLEERQLLTIGPTWSSLGGNVTQAAVAEDNVLGKVDAFAIYAGGTVEYEAFNGAALTNSWQKVSAPQPIPAQQIAVATNVDKTLEVFIVGADNALWHDRELSSGAWTGWQSLGGDVAQIVAQENNASRMIEVYAVDADHSVREIHQTSNAAASEAWSQWTSLGGYLQQIAVAPTSVGGLSELFGVGGDHAVWHDWQTSVDAGGNASWSGWNSLGGYATQVVVQQNMNTDAAEVFIVGGDDAVWHNYQTALPTTNPAANWSGWSSLGGYVSQVCAWWDANNHEISVSAIGYENGVWNNEGSEGQWSSAWSSDNGSAQQITAGGSFRNRRDFDGGHRRRRH